MVDSDESDSASDGRWTSDVLKQAQAAGLSDLVAGRLRSVEKELSRSKRAFLGNPIDDPLFGLAWHLANSGNNGGLRGEDINVIPVWDQGFTGNGVVIGVIDSAVQNTHPDLLGNYRADLSYDFVGNDSEPWSVGSSDRHGTAVAGLAVASDNEIGTVGVAYNSQFASLRLLGGLGLNADAFNSLTHMNQDIDIYNISWGYRTEGLHFESIPDLTKLALSQGVELGRGGLGSIFVVAAGNDDNFGARTSYYGLTSSPYTICVGAVDGSGEMAYYSNRGSSLMLVAPSSGYTNGIVTTDVTAEGGYSPTDYTSSFGGTSGAAPLVSGVVALLLEANPNLTWRDVQHILVNSSFPVDRQHGNWAKNGAGLQINPFYGFGRVDATGALALAQRWQNVAPLSSVEYSNETPQVIPDDTGEEIESVINVPDSISVENVEVTITSDHTYWGDFDIYLRSPSGTFARLAAPHTDSVAQYGTWTFSSVFTWGENSQGEWTLFLEDEQADDSGSLLSWSIKIYGTTAGDNVTNRPVAVDDEFILTERGAPVVVDILANDSDVDNEIFGPISFYQPLWGTLTYNELGELVYTPGVKFQGEDRFGYTLSDLEGNTTKAYATVLDKAPYAIDDQIVTSKNAAIVFDPTANDLDQDNDEMSVIVVTESGNGSSALVSNDSNLVSYTPNTDFRGLNQFEYVVQDTDDGSDIGLVNVFVSNSPDKALYFDNKEDWAFLFHDEPSLATGFTYEFDIYPITYGFQSGSIGTIAINNTFALFTKSTVGSGSNVNTLILALNTQEGEYRTYTAPSNAIALRKWHSVAVTYDPVIGLSLYVDGVVVELTPVGDFTTNPGTPRDSNFVSVGNDFSRQYAFNGLIDDIRVWDTARTDVQIQAKLGGLTAEDYGVLSPIMGSWQFDEGHGVSTADLSLKNFSGVFSGPLWSPKDEDLIQFQLDGI